MRVVVLVKANKDSEAGKLPSAQLLTSMMKFNEELVKAGIMLASAATSAPSSTARSRRRRSWWRASGSGR
jgi:hypothetical protein